MMLALLYPGTLPPLPDHSFECPHCGYRIVVEATAAATPTALVAVLMVMAMVLLAWGIAWAIVAFLLKTEGVKK